MTAGNPMMNGAAPRLLELRQRLETIEAGLRQASLSIETWRRVLQQLHELRDEVNQLVQDVRNAETLTGQDAWRLLLQFDEPFAREFLATVDPAILRLAIMNLDEEGRDRIRECLK